jgi:HTH-type transcriptional regulator/antitoxin HigA
MECGVRYVLIEKLPNAGIDGVCFWLDKFSPVIGMSLQHDRIDNFWFVLRHEIEHVLQRHGQDREMIDIDLDSETSNNRDEEIIANAAASNFCTPTEKLESFVRRKHPFFYQKDVVAFARVLGRHPGIVVGQLRRKLKRYDYLSRYLYSFKIRSFVVPASIADGWGQVIPL